MLSYKLAVVGKDGLTCKLLIKWASKTRLIGTACLSELRIETLIDTVFKFIGIVMFAKGLLDWYIDYRIDKKDKENKNRRYFGKDKRR